MFSCRWHDHAQKSRGLHYDSPSGIYCKPYFPSTDNLTGIGLLELAAQAAQLLA